LLRAQERIPKLLKSYYMAIPSLCYFVQNLLLFVSLQNLNAAAFSVISQSKIFTTAVFSIFLLQRQLSARKWRSLGVLAVGVVLVEWRPDTCAAPLADGQKHGDTPTGILAASTMVGLSGFSAAFLERLLKRPTDLLDEDADSLGTVTIWDQNVQLAFYSFIVAVLSLALDSQDLSENGFFGGYTVLTGFICVWLAFGGLAVAMVVKFADSIVKGFATSMAIVITALCSVVLMDIRLSAFFYLGAAAVLLSVFNYNEVEPTLTLAKPQNNSSSSGPTTVALSVIDTGNGSHSKLMLTQ